MTRFTMLSFCSPFRQDAAVQEDTLEALPHRSHHTAAGADEPRVLELGGMAPTGRSNRAAHTMESLRSIPSLAGGDA
jgi:hypothetical protein